MSIWIWFTIVAAVAQTVRGAYQKKLKDDLGDLGASYVRFSYAIPFSWAFVLAYAGWSAVPLPPLNLKFLLWVTVAGVTQIIFTILLVRMFSHRSFAAGTAFSKTEVIQAAIFEAVILGHLVNLQVGLAIIIGVIAVFILSLAKSAMTFDNLKKSLFTKQTAIGLASGAFLGFCTVAYRAATDSLDSPDLMMRAGFTGGVAVLIQSALMGIWMVRRTPDQLKATFIHWRESIIVGFSGAISTITWFAAFSLYAVAPVRAVGQIELVFVLCISFFYFKEKPTFKELFAMALLALSIVMVLLA
jgi:drug/metabolite transporter (DMT)-like permease